MSIFLLSNLANHSEFGNGILEDVMYGYNFLNNAVKEKTSSSFNYFSTLRISEELNRTPKILRNTL